MTNPKLTDCLGVIPFQVVPNTTALRQFWNGDHCGGSPRVKQRQ